MVRISYDPEHNVAYIKLREEKEEVETIRLSEEVLVDISPDGKVHGIELLNANEFFRLAEGEGLLLTDESTGETVRILLPCGKAEDRKIL